MSPVKELIEQARSEKWTTLDLGSIGLTSLSSEIEKLAGLQSLYLGFNGLNSLPPEIGQLRALQSLSLNNNNLTSLPPEIGQLTALQSLTLNNNNLTSLPPEIGQLAALQSLTLNNNNLTSLPPEIGQLIALQSLTLNNNNLTSLPPEIGQLTALQSLTLNLNNDGPTTLPPEIGQLTALQSLTINNNGPTYLPPEIGQLTALRVLNLSGSRLTSLPAEIGELTALQFLSLRNSHLTYLPSEITLLTGLQSLNLSGNQLTSLPAEIGQLTALQSLNLSGNQLTSLPLEIGQLTALQSLNLSGNQLTSLPPEIGRLICLQILSLKGNPLTGLPPQIGQLTVLQSLYLNRTRLLSLPPEIGQLTALQSLNLSGNQLTSLPPEIGQLAALHSLDLSHTPLTGLPPQIGQLTVLQSLYLNHTRLLSLPPEIGQLTALQSLNLSGNQLTSLPPEIGQLAALHSLNLRASQLPGLPPEIGQLTTLHSLDLSHTHLTKLPPEIGRLTSLQSLDMNGSNLTNLPPGFGQLAALRSLNLNGSHLTSLPPEIGHLAALESLTLNGNHLMSLPPEIVQLTALQSLSLRRNRLTSLPPKIGQMVALQSVDLSRNRLVSLPPEIGQLTGLQFLNLRNNHLTSLPVEIGTLSVKLELRNNPWRAAFKSLAAGPQEELMAYLRSLQQGTPQYDAKVLLVGEGGVGKTSLLAALQGLEFVENRDTTHGIDRCTWFLPHPDIAIIHSLRLNFWDFGGQEVYRVTHQFFFSENALYLLVWKPREGQEQNELERWLERIQIRVGPSARVLLVATHCRERYPELDYPALQRKFSNMLAGHFQVDNSDSTGIPELAVAVQRLVAAMPHMGTPFNELWLNARDALLALPDTHVTRQQFTQVCIEQGLSPLDAQALLTLLYTSGYVIYYNTAGLEDFVVLKPEWLTQAISFILEDRPIRAGGGVLDHRRLRAIWHDHPYAHLTRYPPEYYPYFLRLMEHFDVSVRIPDQDASLVPQLLPYERPPLPWEADTPATQPQLNLVCEMSQEPTGLIPWLTARHYRWTTSTHWRSGLLLRHQDGHEALLDYVSRRRHKLTFTVRGDYPAHFMSLLQDGLEHLIDKRWPYLTRKYYVPCPHQEGGQPCAGRFPLETLRKAKAQGRFSLPCQSCLEDAPVARLLEGFATPEKFLGALQQQINDLGIRLFAALDAAMQERQSYAAQTGEMMRRFLRALLDEAQHGPRLFSLLPVNSSAWDPRNWGREKVRLTLWCEHPGAEHPLDESGQYLIDQPRQWVVRLAPYALTTIKLLRMATLVGSGAAGLAASGALGAAQAPLQQALQAQIAFMEKVAEASFEGLADVDYATEYQDTNRGQFQPGPRGFLRADEAAALRVFHDLLAHVGWQPGQGNLRRITDKLGDVLWVCPEHYAIYDPGLPQIPPQNMPDA